MASENLAPQKTLTLAEYKISKEFCALNPAEKKFVLKFFENRDAQAATEYAYPDIRYQTRMKNLLVSNDRILAAIHRWYGTSERDAMIQRLKKDIRRSKPRSKNRLELTKLLCQVQGLL